MEKAKKIWMKGVMTVAQPVVQRLLPDPYTEAGQIRMDGKAAHVSRVTMTEIITHAQCNIKGFAFAGTILAWIDIAAGIAAKKHANAPAVTRSVDDVAFLHPVKVGDIVTVQASVNKSWKTSMEVGVKVEAESPLAHEKFFVAHAYLTFVALNPRPTKSYLSRFTDYQITVPDLIPVTPMEEKRYKMAETRRHARLTTKKPNYDSLRILLREWSQGLREKADTDAPIKKHPGYFSYLSPDEPIPSEEEEWLIEKKKRRYSTDPRMMQSIKEKPMDDTFVEAVELVMPQHANTLQITFGGQIMAWMESCALASANKLAKAYLLTASIDSLNFISSTNVGDVVTLRSLVSRSFNSSMEVYVSVEAENVLTGETKFTNDGFFTITAVDGDNIPVRIPKSIPQTEAGIEIFESASDRRLKRLHQRQELVYLVNVSQQPLTTIV
ncbi:HotDog domain-containing protein [Pilobolus umbonatus]|nr:HotDog domain-containing protein [Pilobolus umbonatus]